MTPEQAEIRTLEILLQRVVTAAELLLTHTSMAPPLLAQHLRDRIDSAKDYLG